MKLKLGVVMDPIGSIHFKKDSTLAMLFEAQARGWEIFYFEQQDLFLKNTVAHGISKKLKVFHDEKKWFELYDQQEVLLQDLQIILMRKDPPFNLEYIYTTYLLEQAEKAGVLIVNKVQSLRDFNEKLFAMHFPTCCPPTLVTRRIDLLRKFYQEQQDIICKPLQAMGGASVFRVMQDEVNASVIFEMLTRNSTVFMMAQKYIPEITAGDKRIIMINGEAIPFALARMPAHGEFRGNLSAGAKGIAQPLSARDKEICATVGPVLREKGLYFVGLDVIGDFLTEINVTSPTGIRELDAQCGLNISKQLLDSLESQIS